TQFAFQPLSGSPNITSRHYVRKCNRFQSPGFSLRHSRDDTLSPWTYWPRAFLFPSLMPKTPNVRHSFGQHLRRLRSKSGLTQEQLAHVCRLDRSYVGGIERGERNVSLENLAKLARGLEISLRELMNFENSG